ncbi:hypothetical protein [Nonomuraea sp. bgisy101]|uniref:hypothetical protein n=1 Tax=Nonomuraea sp. bgisy101 TaxID=3413784 RepID=UPI003D726B5A
MLLDAWWTAGEQHGLARVHSPWRSDLASIVVDVLAARYCESPDVKASDQLVSLLRNDLVKALGQLGVAAELTPNGPIRVPQLRESAGAGGDGHDDLLVRLDAEYGWYVGIDGDHQSDGGILAPVSQNAVAEVAELVRGMAVRLANER